MFSEKGIHDPRIQDTNHGSLCENAQKRCFADDQFTEKNMDQISPSQSVDLKKIKLIIRSTIEFMNRRLNHD